VVAGDLGSAVSICRVVLQWEAAYATAFQIQVSNDAVNWTSIYSTTTSTGGSQTLTITGTGRYIRVYGTARATQYGIRCGSSRCLAGAARHHATKPPGTPTLVGATANSATIRWTAAPTTSA